MSESSAASNRSVGSPWATSVEHPAKPGHDLESRALVYWISGGEWIGDGDEPAFLLHKHDPVEALHLRPGAEQLTDELLSTLKRVAELNRHRQHKQSIAYQADKGATEAKRLASAALERGLGIRVGLTLGLDGIGYDWLLALGAEPPGSPRVCIDCGMVFEPVRRKKANAAKCPSCHSTPRPEWTVSPERIVSVTPTSRDGQSITGWRRRTLIFCRGCGTIFEPKSKGKGAWCTDRCRKRIERGQTIEPGQALI
jgi:hypothetical protein